MSRRELRKSLKHWKKELSAIEDAIKQGGKSLVLQELLINKKDEYQAIIKTIQKQMREENEKETTENN
jgi:hypothetical protein